MHGDECPNAVEEVGELEETAVEDHVDRLPEVPAGVSAVARRDRVEADPGVAGDPVQLEQHARHVGLARHRLGDAEEVRGADRLGLGSRADREPTVLDLRLRGLDLGRQVRARRSLRRDDDEVAEGADDQEGDDHERDRSRLRDALLRHDVTCAFRRPALIANLTIGRLPWFSTTLEPSLTSSRCGITERRARSRATPSWEYV